MTLTLPSADIRGFYNELGIPLPGWSRTEAPARCFADPDAHRRDDRDPSVSVNLISGAWHCHGCGARGGAYDAALTTGHSPRTAIDLMIAHRLIGRRQRLQTGRNLLHAPSAQPGNGASAPVRAHEASRQRRELHVTDRDLARWQTNLSCRPSLIARLADQRRWRYQTMRDLELGVDRSRITIPVRNAHGDLRGLLRYQPEPTGRPKMLATPGTRLGLIPHPSVEHSPRILLVEGPPDMIAARSHGLPAIAVPGTDGWQPSWATLLADRLITIIMDADRQGRAAAQRIARDLQPVAIPQVVDIASHRDDGYDLTDWLLDNACLAAASAADFAASSATPTAGGER
jgi:hypothetical protein